MFPKRQNAFTLVEIMIVVVIVGLLAAMAMPAFTKAKRSAQNSRLVNDFKVLSGQVEIFSLETGNYPEDSNSGAIPSGFGPYITLAHWNEGPSIGGVWDIEYEDNGITSAIGAHRYTAPEEQLLSFDQKYDDGSLATGKYRKLAADRYYYIIAE